MRKLGRSLSYANVMATVAVFLALGGGAFAATSALVTKNGTIHACVSKSSHLLTVVKAGQQCDRRHVALTFNAKGVRGARGLSGRDRAGRPGRTGRAGGPTWSQR